MGRMKDVYIDMLNAELDQERQAEEADHQFNLMQDRFTRSYSVPTGKQNPEKAKQAVAEAIASFKDDVDWDTVTGNASIAGRENNTYNKEYWFPESEQKTFVCEEEALIAKLYTFKTLRGNRQGLELSQLEESLSNEEKVLLQHLRDEKDERLS